ncbi:hypothetical protein ABZU45_01485 [Streptomyces avermitilis]|uniref:hypothetical protein n=1 Tax=Streptomyces avermitilis TaxID=33903 RepID=UPI0033A6D0BF
MRLLSHPREPLLRAALREAEGAYLVVRGTDDGFDPKKAQLFTPDAIGVPLRLK